MIRMVVVAAVVWAMAARTDPNNYLGIGVAR
jgi:hypothetical protein